MSFVNEDEVLRAKLRKCPLCKQEYIKSAFKTCDICAREVCLKCAVIAGKYGLYCKECFEKLPEEKREIIGKEANKINFWAKKGYQFFIAFLVVSLGSFSLIFFNRLFFIVGIILTVITFIFGYYLFNYLVKSQEGI
ncbi:MAG: hypothetical protein R6U96_18195 [Promethearchaeia archaeon]